MPFVSKAQQKAMHAKANRGEIANSTVKEFDQATRHKPGGFKSLPEHAKRGLKQAMGREGRGGR